MIVLGIFKHWWETAKHKGWVSFYLFKSLLAQNVADWPEIARRAVVHDLSKFRWDETSGFARTIFRLPKLTYGTQGYQDALDEIRPSIALHYQRNRHHPDHHRRGVYGMSPLDRLEMVADWAAAVRRHRDGNLSRSIEQNAARFDYNEPMEYELRELAVHMGALDKDEFAQWCNRNAAQLSSGWIPPRDVKQMFDGGAV